ncbi:MAG: hypothetical protein Q4B22_07080 [Eubacteriales bacterium]|nr:hypothetical protein [Eubacteriales bacterium]
MDRKNWVERYMREVKTKRRKALLEQGIAEDGMSPDNELRKKLFDARYGKAADQEVDYFIRGWLDLLYVKEASRSVFAKAKLDKIHRNVQKDWKISMIDEYGAIGREVYYEELFQLMQVYIHLCKEDKTYNSVVLGLGRIKEDQLIGKISNDLLLGAVDAAKAMKAEEEPLFVMLKAAAKDAFCEAFPDDCDSFLEKCN